MLAVIKAKQADGELGWKRSPRIQDGGPGISIKVARPATHAKKKFWTSRIERVH